MDLGDRTLEPGTGHWTLDTGHWILETGYLTLDTGLWTQDTGLGFGISGTGLTRPRTGLPNPHAEDALVQQELTLERVSAAIFSSTVNSHVCALQSSKPIGTAGFDSKLQTLGRVRQTLMPRTH
jgi:hypothetical protein